MRIAVIDLGTNSVRFDVHDISPSGEVVTLFRDKIMVRLGQDVFLTRRLNPEAAHRTVHAFRIFRRALERLHVSKTIALGTSALREATDGGLFVRTVAAKTGIQIKVISGKEEARLIALGILKNEKLPKGRVALLDIGGGSTEISICSQGKVLHAESFALGTARLQQIFLKHSPPKKSDFKNMREHVGAMIHRKSSKWPHVDVMLGSSGTVKALLKILRNDVGKKGIPLSAISKLVEKMSQMSPAELLRIDGMESKRVDMILAGTTLLEEAMRTVGAKHILPTTFSLRDGILAEQIEISRSRSESELSLHIPDLISKAERFGTPKIESQRTVKLCASVFDRLAKFHKLKRSWLLLLQAAAVLRHSGECVSPMGAAEHTYYVIKESQFPFMTDFETEVVAQVARVFGKNKLGKKDVPFSGKLRKEFLRLVGLLAIVDALDTGSVSKLRVKHVKKVAGAVELHCSGKSQGNIEGFLLDQRSGLLRQTLGFSAKYV